MFPEEVELNEANIAKLTSLYKQSYAQIVAELETATNFGVANRRALLAQIKEILKELGASADDIITLEISTAYKTGAKDAVDQLRKIGAEIPVSTGFNRIHKDAILALIDDTSRAFGESIQGVNRSSQLLLNTAVREQITQQMAQGKIGGKALREIRNTVSGILRTQGLDALIDKGGHGWTLDRYSEMLIRTKAVEARNRGLANRMVENEYDLVEVSSHGADDVCADWEGKILSVSGETKGYPTVAEAESDGLFHPNCKHAINALVPALSRLTHAYDPNEETMDGYDLQSTIGKVKSGAKNLEKEIVKDVKLALEEAKSQRGSINFTAPIGQQTDFVAFRGEGVKSPVHSLDAYGKGKYYSTDPEYAKLFGEVKEVNIHMDNPLVFNNRNDVEEATNMMITDGFDSLSGWAKAKGFDGILDKETEILMKL